MCIIRDCRALFFEWRNILYSHNLNSEKYIVKLTLNSGISKETTLTKSQLEEWIECFRIDKKFITIVENSHLAIDPKLVARFDLREVK